MTSPDYSKYRLAVAKQIHPLPVLDGMVYVLGMELYRVYRKLKECSSSKVGGP